MFTNCWFSILFNGGVHGEAWIFKIRRNSLNHLMEFLGRYEAASGQLINKTKSCFVIQRNAPRCRVDMIGSVVGFPRKELPIMYLGAPLFAGAPKASFFTFLVDKIIKQIASWNGKLLSKGGRLVLLKSVLYSIPIIMFYLSQQLLLQ